jgi:hypothetical protein
MLLIVAVVILVVILCRYASSPSTAVTTRDVYYPSDPRRYSPEYPASRHIGRIFTIETSEGEVCELNTSDPSSPFHGPAWTHILTAREKGEFVRGHVKTRLVSRDSRFSGYLINIEGVDAFLPASKAAWFYHPEHDACGKAIALGIEEIYTSGKKVGNLVVSAYAPLRHLARNQSKKDYEPGATPFAIAMDYDETSLIFPHYGDKALYVPLQEAMNIALGKGLDAAPRNLTGYCWQLRIIGWKGNQCAASPIDVLND